MLELWGKPIPKPAEEMKREGFFFFICSGTGPADSGAQVGAKMGVFVGHGVKVRVGIGVTVGVPVGEGVPSAQEAPAQVMNTKDKQILVFINFLSNPNTFLEDFNRPLKK